jgi:hypothetical protein
VSCLAAAGLEVTAGPSINRARANASCASPGRSWAAARPASSDSTADSTGPGAAMTLDVYADLFESDLDTVAESVGKMWARQAN